MRRISTDFNYLTIEALIQLINSPQRDVCSLILVENRVRFEHERASKHNHQTWEGGYIDHVVECMNIARLLYAVMAATGRTMSFSLSDALLVMFLHDLAKPWREEARLTTGSEEKEAHEAFRDWSLKTKYGLVLTKTQMNGLEFVEGECMRYSDKERLSSPLAAFCHMVDHCSARVWYDYPRPENAWIGARRSRVTI